MTNRRLAAICLLLSLSGTLHAQDGDYQLGLGKQINDWMTVGGYLSTEYFRSDSQQELLVDDLALLVYGDTGGRFSYLAEVESVEPWVRDLDAHATTTNLPPTIERLYVDYKFSDQVAVRIGKQITPIGYWNLQPINVLQETTSNPLYSQLIFPRFLTGVDIHGYLPGAGETTYHLFLQDNRDMDEANINIRIDSHYGFSLEKVFASGWQLGGSIGRFHGEDESNTRYLELNTRVSRGRFTFLSEGSTSLRRLPDHSQVQARAAYAQGEFHFTPQHALIGRVEYFHDPLQGPVERIAVTGYSYRPIYPVSLKIEHQWHDDSSRNMVMASFSVLF